MKILLHICCAPCSIYPLDELRREGLEVTGFFWNHNIHPYQEFRKRLEAVKTYGREADLPVMVEEEYFLDDFLRAVAAEPSGRCRYCYASRLDVAACKAAAEGFPAFTTSLLYSRYQQHDVIRQLGEEAAARHGIKFRYDDYRRGWRQGIDQSKALGLYRQQYCGCIYSERDRYGAERRR